MLAAGPGSYIKGFGPGSPLGLGAGRAGYAPRLKGWGLTKHVADGVFSSKEDPTGEEGEHDKGLIGKAKDKLSGE